MHEVITITVFRCFHLIHFIVGPMTTFQDIADELDMELERVRNILREDPDTVVPEEEKDNVFETARDLGYDFSKLKIGKRMMLRKRILSDLENEIRDHPDWNRQDIVDHLIEAQELVDRVTNRAFQDEFETADVTQE